MAEQEKNCDNTTVVLPLTELAAMAAMHHEIFEAYRAAGFSRQEALMLVIAWIQRDGEGSLG